MALGTDPRDADPQAADAPTLPLHARERPLDAAFASLTRVAPGAFLHCLGDGAGSTDLPPMLRDRLPGARWIPASTHPLTFIDPADHLRVHHAWLRACHGPDRVAQATVRTVQPLRPADDGPTGPVGTYHVQLIDLVSIEGIDAVVVTLEEAGPDEALRPATPARRSTPTLQPLIELAGPRLETTDLGFRTLAESLPVGVAVLDEAGMVHFANHRLVTLFNDLGLSGPRSDVQIAPPAGRNFTSSWLDLLSPDFARRVAWIVAPQPESAEPVSGRFAVEGLDGNTHHLLIQAMTIRADGASNVILSVQDVSEQTDAWQAHARLSQVVDAVDDLVAVADHRYRITYANQAARRFFGADLVGTPMLAHATPGLVRLFEDHMEPVVAAGQIWSGDVEMRDSAGRLRTMAVVASPVPGPGGSSHLGLTLRDVTSERAHARELAALARRDDLTGLPNRLALMEALAATVGSGTPADDVTLFFIDVDNLKVVNDSLGHSAGDRVLQAVARELARTADGDLTARFGGDEFVVVAEGMSHEAAEHQAQGFLDAVRRAGAGGVANHLTASIGVAVARRQALDPESLVRDADAAMYAAKRAGRGRCAVFDQDLRNQVSRRFLLERALREAIGTDELDVHFQPVVRLSDGTIGGFEALCRWGRVSPGEFIPVAEESGLIGPLGAQVLARALAGATRLRRELPHLAQAGISFNVSARELDDPAFASRTLATVAASDVPPSAVIVELTESVLLDHRPEVVDQLQRLRDAGLLVALDDFGSGYSSLSYLRRYPIDIIKLDLSYTQAMVHDPDCRVIVEALVAMARRLGLRVLAEGVETEAQLHLARELGMDWAQGFLTGRAARVEDHLARGPGPDGPVSAG